MGQLGFFDLNRRYDGLNEKNDPLVAIAAMVQFESFRPKLQAALIKGELRRKDAERKSSAGRKPWDEVVIFKALVLQALYNLSDDQAEYQLRDRLSFMRFLGLGLEDAVPDAETLWLYREALAKAGAVEGLFDLFDGFLKDNGYLAMGGQIIDATIVSAPKQHNSREENETIKDGGTPEDWKQKPAKNRQKDKDARWTKKHERSYFGYKNHIGVDRRHKFVRRCVVSDASVHDSQKLPPRCELECRASDHKGHIFRGAPELQEIAFRQKQVTMFEIKLQPALTTAEIEAVKAKVSRMGSLLATPTDQLLQHDRNLLVMNAISRSVSLIALTMGALSVLNALLMAVQERTREIGIMAAIGWSRARTMASIVFEGVLIGVAGCFVGVPLSYGISLLFGYLPTIGDILSFHPNLSIVLPTLLVSIVLCAAGSIYPAWRAVSMSPADALRRP